VYSRFTLRSSWRWLSGGLDARRKTSATLRHFSAAPLLKHGSFLRCSLVLVVLSLRTIPFAAPPPLHTHLLRHRHDVAASPVLKRAATGLVRQRYCRSVRAYTRAGARHHAFFYARRAAPCLPVSGALNIALSRASGRRSMDAGMGWFWTTRCCWRSVIRWLRMARRTSLDVCALSSGGTLPHSSGLRASFISSAVLRALGCSLAFFYWCFLFLHTFLWRGPPAAPRHQAFRISCAALCDMRAATTVVTTLRTGLGVHSVAFGDDSGSSTTGNNAFFVWLTALATWRISTVSRRLAALLDKGVAVGFVRGIERRHLSGSSRQSRFSFNAWWRRLNEQAPAHHTTRTLFPHRTHAHRTTALRTRTPRILRHSRLAVASLSVAPRHLPAWCSSPFRCRAVSRAFDRFSLTRFIAYRAVPNGENQRTV